MTFLEKFGTAILSATVKKWLLIPLQEMYLLSKFGRCSSSTSRNMTDKQNHMTMPILCHQQLRRIPLRLFTKRYICFLVFLTVTPLEKEMCLIVKVTWLNGFKVGIIGGRVFLWRIFSSSGVRLSNFGGCCFWRTKDIN